MMDVVCYMRSVVFGVNNIFYNRERLRFSIISRYICDTRERQEHSYHGAPGSRVLYQKTTLPMTLSDIRSYCQPLETPLGSVSWKISHLTPNSSACRSLLLAENWAASCASRCSWRRYDTTTSDSLRHNTPSRHVNTGQTETDGARYHAEQFFENSNSAA